MVAALAKGDDRVWFSAPKRKKCSNTLSRVFRGWSWVWVGLEKLNIRGSGYVVVFGSILWLRLFPIVPLLTSAAAAGE